MKKSMLKNKSVFFTAFAMLVLYLVSTVGFGMHTCHSSNSSHLFFSYAHEGCGHGDLKSCCSSCAEDNVADVNEPVSVSPQECCSDCYFQIDTDQLDSRSNVSATVLLPVILRNIEYEYELLSQRRASYGGPAATLLSVDISTFCSQWRI